MGAAAHTGVRAGHNVNRLSFCLGLLLGLSVSRNTYILSLSSVPLSFISFGLHVCVSFEFDCIIVRLGAGQQHSNIFAKFRTEAEVDEWIVEACRLGKKPSENTGQTGYVEATC